MDETVMDETRLMQAVEATGGFMAGAAVVAGAVLGDRLGLYRALAGRPPSSADDLAAEVGANGRLVREWLDGQAAAGIVDYDAAEDTYGLSVEQALVYADDTSPVFLARAMQTLVSLGADIERIEAAFRGDGALGWSEHHHSLFHGVEWFFRTGYRAHLATEWIPALDGIEAALVEGADVLDVGCGHGASLAVLADAFPASRFVGVDSHRPSIDVARERLDAAGLGERVTLELADAAGYEGDYDLICFFDCLHDLGDPVGAARHARQHLRPGGSVLLVEPFAVGERGSNIATNPIAALMYHASAMICVPNSLSQDVGLGLGGQAGQARLADVMASAGFGSLELRVETPFNLVLQAKT